MKHNFRSRLVRYVLVGSSVTFFQLVSFVFFLDLLGLHYQVSTAIAFVLTVFVSFEAQRRITYAPTEGGRQNNVSTSGVLFILNTGLGLALVSGVMHVGVAVLSLNVYLVKIVAVGLLAVCNFFILHVIYR